MFYYIKQVIFEFTMQKHPHHNTEKTIEAIDAQIAYYQSRIDNLKATREMLVSDPPPDYYLFDENSKLTKDLVRAYLRQSRKPVQTVEVIDALYPRAEQEVKDKAVKTLSVIFNTLEKDRQITVEKRTGVKGNFYTWINEDDGTNGRNNGGSNSGINPTDR